MSTFTQIYYHIVFSTKNRERVLLESARKLLFRYVWGIVKNKNSYLYRINRVEDHLHILTSLHPKECLADFIKDIKVSTSNWIKTDHIFPKFTHWQNGYSAFTLSSKEKDRISEYIEKQVEHHRLMTFQDELKLLLAEAGVEYEEKYLI